MFKLKKIYYKISKKNKNNIKTKFIITYIKNL